MERSVPGRSAVVPDARGEGRALRVTWHPEAGVVVLSVWRDNVCVATTRLSPDEAAGLVEVLASGLADGYDGVPQAHPEAG
ncbi:hypothetical protein [Arthrobacter sp. NEB 688]|uniref:hypothetical protein n=1 Tax=Arthrobacter sp. NEB 688 TaxID=904039 RepID=UPI001563EA14|nr:hypothetical protein [Arthrobacter sp. NEB 688]QKE84625.1 hypothetical protein HL663_12195 [Arthrobacter sp. NEB 688]